MTQVERLVAYLRANPGASSLEIVRDCSIVNTTGRISDIRKIPGLDVDCRKRGDGHDGYWLTEGNAAPGFARFTADDSPANIERKVTVAFQPVSAALEAWDRVFGGES